ncbi:MAG: mannose-1-phosphate guanylyltransferase [Treponema sp.]|jgi:mannose-1-phosphate guanylyltransferase/mannose-1-phosphate guanylyltransferase/mannose-6-phosphate isomerase|nr:mannose-1-phosphate guanylyltransferase [Treponema sp.]
MFDHCIIMAGGGGTRLWPASTSRKPKQFLSIPPEGSFFSAALERALAATAGGGRVIIIAGRNHVDPVVEACAGLGAGDKKRLVLIPEPAARNTAPAVACGLVYSGLAGGGRERTILVLTSDHSIRPLEVFTADAAAAAAFARQDRLVIFGIPPGSPETGYGYIETSGLLPPPEAAPGENPRQDKNRRDYEPEVYRVVSFREKPDRQRAEAFVKAGNFFWNSGMFAFSSPFMVEQFHKNAGDVILPFDKLKAPDERSYKTQKGLKVLAEWEGLEAAYEAAESISFDYAVAEKCDRTVMVKAAFRWADVGSWDEYARLAGGAGAEVYQIDSESTFVDSDIPVALCGADNLIVAVRSGRDGSPPAVLIAAKGQTQKVREIVEQIKAAGRTDLL